MAKQFKLYRNLGYGMQGEDVRLMQKLLNLVNETNPFYTGKIPENGVFDMFRTRICLTRFQEWTEVGQRIFYDQETHSMLLTAANNSLRYKNVPSHLWYVK